MIKGGKYAFVMGFIISLCFTVFIVIFPSVFISIFNRDSMVVSIGNSYLRIVSVFYVVFAVIFPDREDVYEKNRYVWLKMGMKKALDT